jgi:hypothetical protein
MIMCPVEETGRNSLIPSKIPNTIACQMDIRFFVTVILQAAKL